MVVECWRTFAGPVEHRGEFIAPLVALACFVSTAAIGVWLRSLFGQILARGVVWLVLLSAAWAAILGGRISPIVGVYLVGSALYLITSSRAVHSAEARRAFAPIAYRPVFLAAAVAMSVA